MLMYTLGRSPLIRERARPAAGRHGAVTIALANQKGGVGKTTSAVNLSVALAAGGYRVLLVDIDPQGNATSSLGIEKSQLEHTVYDLLVGNAPARDVVVQTGRDRLQLLPSAPELAGAEVELVDVPARETRLKQGLLPLAKDVDLILIDCPPSLGLITVNALTAADLVLVPIQCEFLALEGVGQLINTIDLVRQHLNPSLDIIGVLMTMFDARTRLSQHVVNEVKSYFPDRIFSDVIPRSVRLAEAPSYGQAIIEYDRPSRGSVAYRAVAAELLERLGMKPLTLAQPVIEPQHDQMDGLATVVAGSVRDTIKEDATQ
jgi:chromosome partitioning protein